MKYVAEDKNSPNGIQVFESMEEFMKAGFKEPVATFSDLEFATNGGYVRKDLATGSYFVGKTEAEKFLEKEAEVQGKLLALDQEAQCPRYVRDLIIRLAHDNPNINIDEDKAIQSVIAFEDKAQEIRSELAEFKAEKLNELPQAVKAEVVSLRAKALI